jgi:putative endonuclease
MTTGTEARPTQRLGRWGEELAAFHLERRGMTVLDRNWRCEHGEIDIVALDGDCLVVCEVKTRRGMAHGGPVHAIGWAKLLRLRRLAAAWLAVHDRPVAGVRIDVVGIVRPASGPAELVHLPGVQ